MNTGVAIDLVILCLLIVAIASAWRLDRRLAALKRERGQLADLMEDFNKATAQVDEGLKALRLAAEDIGRGLETLVAKGQGLRDDLGYLVERGEPLADRLADGVRARTAPRAPGAGPAPAPPSEAPVGAEQPAEPPVAAAASPRRDAPHTILRATREAAGRGEPRSDIERELLKALAALR